MARYREKDGPDLVWNKIRRRITRELDIAIADRREEVLNALLTKAWDDFTAALADDKLKEVESRYARYVESIARDIVPELAAGEADE